MLKEKIKKKILVRTSYQGKSDIGLTQRGGAD